MDTPPQHAETTPPEPAGKPQITIDDFLKIDLRVATVKSATAHPNADKLIVLQLDDGTENGRQICAGLRGIYEPDQLVGKQIVVVANLAPRKMRGETSEGMLLAASDDGRSNVVLVSPAGEVAPGSGVG